MYTDYYNLKEKPFDISPDPKFAWLGDKHAEAIAMMEYGIIENRGFLLLTGDVGVGKTLMVNCLLKRIGSDIIVVKIANPKMAPVDFFNFMSAKLGWGKIFNTKGKFLLYFENYLHELYADNKQMLLIIDEAQRINDKILEEIRLLSNIELEYKKLVNIFIVGQKELENLVNKEKNKSLRERISIWYSIEPLSENETRFYIRYRLKTAGNDSDIFRSDAIQKIHSFSNGIPRRINILCDQAMVAGFTSNMKKINSQIIEECAKHLRMTSDETQIENLIQTIDGEKRKQAGDQKKTILAEKTISQDLEIMHHANEKMKSEEKADKEHGARPPTSEKTMSASILRRFAGLSILLLIIIAIFVYKLEPLSLKDRPFFRLGSHVENSGILSMRQVSAPETLKKKTRARTNDPVKPPEELEKKGLLKLLSKAEKDSYVDAKNERYYPNMNLVVYIEYNLTELNDKALAELDRLADFMTYNPDTKIKVKGYSDNSGLSDYDLYISDMRAKIIKTYLANKGIHDSRIKAKGLGPKNPIASNETRQGRRLNRRVEIEFYSKKPM